MDTPEALARLRRHHEGVLLADGRPHPVRFVFASASGRVVSPISSEALDAEELVLFAPDESDDAMQLLLEPAPDSPHPSDRDRHLAYHGQPRHRAWLHADIVALRWAHEIIDGDGLTVPNPLRADEPDLCRLLNENRDALRELCSRHAAVTPTEPVAVGVDPDGIDVRARFGVVRVAFDRTSPDAGQARETILGLLGREP